MMQRALLLCLCLLVLLPLPAHAAKNELHLFIWSEYIPDSVLKQFTKATGVKVKVSTYDSNELLYAKMQLLKGEGHDVIVPSADYVQRLAREGLLQPLDKSRLTNLGNLDPRFLGQAFDPENAWSIPFMWGSTNMAVNTAVIKEPVTSYADLWRPEAAGRLVLPNDMRAVLVVGLKMLGYSVNDTDPAHVKQAYEKVAPLMPAVKVFDSDSPKTALLSGEAAMGVAWNAESFLANQDNPAIVGVYPKEGYSLWVDNLCIPKGAPNPEAAHLFLDFILRPEIGAAISQEMGYATPNLQSLALLPEALRQNRMVYPSPEEFARGEFELDLGPAMGVYEHYWNLLRSR